MGFVYGKEQKSALVVGQGLRIRKMFVHWDWQITLNIVSRVNPNYGAYTLSLA